MGRSTVEALEQSVLKVSSKAVLVKKNYFYLRLFGSILCVFDDRLNPFGFAFIPHKSGATAFAPFIQKFRSGEHHGTR
jgi:hypothetical protein